MQPFTYVYTPQNDMEWFEYYEALKYVPSFLRGWSRKILSVKEASGLLMEETGNIDKGMLLICPCLGERMICQIRNWCECHHAQVLGFTPTLESIRHKVVSQNGEKRLLLPTGQIFEAIFFLEALKQELILRKENIQHLSITIDGAATCLGQLCAYLLASEVRFMTLIDDDQRGLERLAKKIIQETGLAVKRETRLQNALSQTQVLVCTRPVSGIVFNKISENTLVCCLNQMVFPEKIKSNNLMGGPCIHIPQHYLTPFHRLPAGELVSSRLAETIFSALEYSLISRYIRVPLQITLVNRLIIKTKEHGFLAKGLRKIRGE